MDAPNDPNPINHAAQDQFMNAVQGPAAQYQAQGPADQAQGPTAQGPANNNAPVSQNVPIQPPHQLAQHNQSPLVWWCLPLRYFIKIG